MPGGSRLAWPPPTGQTTDGARRARVYGRDAVLRLIGIDLFQRAGRTWLTSFGIAIGVATIVALLSLSAGIERAVGGLVNLGDADIGVFQGGLSDLSASSLPESLAGQVRRQPGVADAVPIAVLSHAVPGHGSFLVFGVPLDSFVIRRQVFSAGRPPRGPSELVLGDAAARDLGVRVGSRLSVAGRTFPVVGVYHAGVPFEDQGAGLALSTVERLRRRPGDVTTVAVAIAKGARTADVARRLQRTFAGTVALSEPGQVARADTNSLLIHKATIVFAVIALLLGAIVVMNTMLLAVSERSGEFALLLAVGWPVSRIAQLIVGEGVVVAAVGGLVGIALGVGSAELVVRALSTSGLVQPHVTAAGLAIALAFALATGLVGSVYPAWRVSRLRVTTALG